MSMAFTAPLPTEKLPPLPKRISPESEQNGNRRGQWDSGHQTKRANQRTDDLLSDKLKIDQISIITTSKREHEEHGQRRARISQNQRIDGRRHMILSNAHGRLKQGAESERFIRMVQLENR